MTTATRPRAGLVLNPGSGSASRMPADRLRELLSAGYEVEVFEMDERRGPDACARAALASGVELVIAAGGDGTVSAVAGALIGGEVPLGVIPRGTANSVAAALGIPDDAEGACQVLLAGETRPLDLARCGERVLILHCSVGLHAETITETADEAKRRWGVLAYLATGLRKLTSLEPFAVELTTDDHTIRCRAVAVTVANLAPAKTLVAQGPPVIAGDDGLLDVTLLAPTSLLEAVATGFELFRTAGEEPARRDEIGYLSARSLRIVATPPQRVLIDGEDAGTTPVEVTCLPAAIRVVAPRAAEERPGQAVKLAGLPDLEVEPR